MCGGNKPTMPAPYRWVLEKGLAGFEPWTALQPWYFLREAEVFEPTATWPAGPSKARLVAFARRQDCDDIACFEFGSGEPDSVVVIHGWTEEGYSIDSRHASFWDWMKTVIDDIAQWMSCECDG